MYDEYHIRPNTRTYFLCDTKCTSQIGVGVFNCFQTRSSTGISFYNDNYRKNNTVNCNSTNFQVIALTRQRPETIKDYTENTSIFVRITCNWIFDE